MFKCSTFCTRRRRLFGGLSPVCVQLGMLVLALVVQTEGDAATADQVEARLRMAYWTRPLANFSGCFTETLHCRDANVGLPSWQPAPPLIILTACSSCAEAVDSAVAFVRAALALPRLAVWQVSHAYAPPGPSSFHHCSLHPSSSPLTMPAFSEYGLGIACRLGGENYGPRNAKSPLCCVTCSPVQYVVLTDAPTSVERVWSQQGVGSSICANVELVETDRQTLV